MKKTLLLLFSLVATLGSFADEWQKPVYSGSFQPLTADETVYVYNTEAQLFFTEGNDYGTHATVGDTGLPFIIKQYIPEEGEWDGSTYTIQVNSVAKSGWHDLFIDTSGRDMYVDRNEQENYFFQFTSLGSNLYQIKASDVNPDFNTNGGYDTYLVGHYTDYVDIYNGGIATGTGIIFDNRLTEFHATWAFVSSADYDTYLAQVQLYETAQKLKSILDEAFELGGTDINTADEAAVYSNTSSNQEALDNAIESVKQKMTQYLEETITPTTPREYDNDACNTISGWTNEIGATTWNTQTWIGDSWTGFDGTTLNIWGASMNGKAYKQLANLPNGIYVVNIAVYSQNTDSYVYANENSVRVPAGESGKSYKVTTEVTDGSLEYGISMDNAATNWLAVDNAVVSYYGSGMDAYKFWLQGLLDSAPEFDENETVAQTSLIQAYSTALTQARAAINTATTKQEVLDIIPPYETALNNLSASMTAYQQLQDALTLAEDMTNSDVNTYYEELLTAIMEAKQPILDTHTDDNATVEAATQAVQDVIDEANSYIEELAKFKAELVTAAQLYDTNATICSQAAAQAYNDFLDENFKPSTTTLNNEDNITYAEVYALLQQLYVIESNLNKPAEPASDTNPVDYTDRVAYPSFYDGGTGWTNDGWTTFEAGSWKGSFVNEYVIDDRYLNLWNPAGTTPRVYQMINELPAGTYVLQISAFADADGLQVYANDNFLDVVSGQNTENIVNSYSYNETPEDYNVEVTVTDEGTGETSTVVETPSTSHGNIYRIITTVGEDGTLEIGARNAGGQTLWAMLDNVKLTYYGTESAKIPTAIQQAEAAGNKAAAIDIYTPSGTKVNTLQKGINIVKMSNGQMKKIMIK